MTVTEASTKWGYFIKIWVGYFKIQGEINLVRINNTPRYNEHGLYQIHRYRTLVSDHKSTLSQLFCLLYSSNLKFLKNNSDFTGDRTRSLGPLSKIMITTLRAPLISSFTEAMFYHEQRTDTLKNFTSQRLHVFILISKARFKLKQEAWKLTTIKNNLTRESNFWIGLRTMRS